VKSEIKPRHKRKASRSGLGGLLAHYRPFERSTAIIVRFNGRYKFAARCSSWGRPA